VVDKISEYVLVTVAVVKVVVKIVAVDVVVLVTEVVVETVVVSVVEEVEVTVVVGIVTMQEQASDTNGAKNFVKNAGSWGARSSKPRRSFWGGGEVKVVVNDVPVLVTVVVAGITSVEITVEVWYCVAKEVACTVTVDVTVEILSKDVQKASAWLALMTLITVKISTMLQNSRYQ
jgi:hypothetical protein